MAEQKTENYIPRPNIIDELMKRVFPHFMSNEDTKTKTHFLSTYFKCDCTDCWGDDSERECLVEKAFFTKEEEKKTENPYYEHFGNTNSNDENVIEHTML
jgi:hypothetical protein